MFYNNYKQKYLKYKNKYLNLLNKLQFGGGDHKGNKETITIEFKVDDELHSLLSQEGIKDEMQYNVTEIPYDEYISGPITSKSKITNKILQSLFEQFPEYYNIRNKLIISTFRTSKLANNGGMNGETSWHMDNILFPGNKNRNLLITWGLGTDALTVGDSKRISNLIDDLKENHRQGKITIEQMFPKHGPPMFDPDYYLKPEEIIGSESPMQSGNIKALIISGKEVYHRRQVVKDESLYGTYRYALNIYYDSNDL
jgi:hypothetical protein